MDITSNLDCLKTCVDVKKSTAYICYASPLANSILFYLAGSGHFFTNDFYFMTNEGLKSYMICHTINGKGGLFYRDRRYEIQPDNIFLIDVTEYYEYYCQMDNNWEMLFVNFNGNTSRGFFDIIIRTLGPVFTIPEKSRIPEYMSTIHDMVEKRDIYYEIKASAIIHQILSEILIMAEITTDSHIKIIPLMEQVEFLRVYMEENFSSKVKLREIANSLHISVNYLIKQFKKLTGYTPHEYLINYRINMAKDMLNNTGYTIDEISEKVGYESTSTFIRMFSDTVGTTPLKYRSRKT